MKVSVPYGALKVASNYLTFELKGVFSIHGVPFMTLDAVKSQLELNFWLNLL